MSGRLDTLWLVTSTTVTARAAKGVVRSRCNAVPFQGWGEMSKPETLPEIAERLEGSLAHQILAALREVEARGEQSAAKLGGALLDSAVESAEARVAKLADKLSDWALSDDMTNILGAGGSYVELEKTCNELALRAEKAEARVKELEMEAEARDWEEMRREEGL